MSQDESLAGQFGIDIDRLRHDLQHDQSEPMRRRRSIIGLSLVGMASMTAASLLQTDLVKHLPLPGFDSDKVNSSDNAYQFGTLSLASLAANIPLAAFGEADRTRQKPWVPLAAAAKAAVEAAGASWYFYQMPAKENAWCAYCITGVLVNVGLLALTLPEASEVLAALREPS